MTQIKLKTPVSAVEDAPAHKRRVRYRGTHPRRFAEKYKELDPERYAAEMAKVQLRGQTPAGTHRPIMVHEIIEALAPIAGEVGLDATMGFGGHTAEILPRVIPGGHVYGIDVDPLEIPRTEERLRGMGFGPEVLTVRRMNFAGITQLATEVGGFDFVLADLGVSSMQIDNPSRGFTYKFEGPLDLRLNPQRGEPAKDLLARLDEVTLRDLLVENSDEPHARAVAQALFRRKEKVQTTLELANTVRMALEFLPIKIRKNETKKTLARVFQALRIAVNDEFGVLDQFLRHLPQCLRPGGRVAILTFHSGEDRRVKKSFQEAVLMGSLSASSADPLRPSGQERRDNPRSTCAKLRWAVKGRGDGQD